MLNLKEPYLVLAPLAGYSDLPFRSVVKKFGVDWTISEMISSNALVYNSKKTFKMLEKAPNEIPYFVQIAGNNPNIIKEAVLILNKFDNIDGIDLNAGCPAPKVFNHGSGSALIKDLDKLKAILLTIKEYSNKKYTTIKIRIGVDEKIPLKIVEAINSVGVDIISVHGRTKQGAYKAPVDYDAIKLIKENTDSIVIANGDIKDRKKAYEVLDYTKANGVMIGRGAIGKPWIFYEIKHNKSISKDEKKEIILEHFRSMVEFYGEYGAVMFRKFLHSYSKGYDGASEFRNLINTISKPEVLEGIIEGFF